MSTVPENITFKVKMPNAGKDTIRLILKGRDVVANMMTLLSYLKSEMGL